MGYFCSFFSEVDRCREITLSWFLTAVLIFLKFHTDFASKWFHNVIHISWLLMQFSDTHRFIHLQWCLIWLFLLYFCHFVIRRASLMSKLTMLKRPKRRRSKSIKPLWGNMRSRSNILVCMLNIYSQFFTVFSRVSVVEKKWWSFISILTAGMLRRWDDSQKYLSDNPHLVREETANYLVIMCIDLEVEEVNMMCQKKGADSNPYFACLLRFRYNEVSFMGCCSGICLRLFSILHHFII